MIENICQSDEIICQSDETICQSDEIICQSDKTTCDVIYMSDHCAYADRYKNDQEVIENARVKVLKNGKILEITGTEVTDTARYMCVARNLAGETEKSFDLNIQGMIVETVDQYIWL